MWPWNYRQVETVTLANTEVLCSHAKTEGITGTTVSPSRAPHEKPDDMIERCDFVKRIEAEPENDKPGLMRAFDEIITGPVDYVHIERMSDDCYWMVLVKGDEGQRIIISAKNPKAKIVARTELD